jgi:NhaA family Na+:H+ antiporter
VFGNGHPAIAFLLLLAVADDGIGLGIIAIFYPDPLHPTEWLNTLWILPGMAAAYMFRRMDLKPWWPYIFIGGGLSWWGLYNAHLHPALALVPIVPLLPGPDRDEGLFQDDVTTIETDTLNNFEHSVKTFVDFGLFFFAFANAGVPFSNLNNLTWIVLLALLVGKTVGIFFFSYVGALIGFPLPQGMKAKHLLVAGVVAGLGLTVALFVAGQAFKVDIDSQGAAKMGALFSGGIALVAIVLGKMLGVKDGAGQEKPAASAVKEE